MTEQQPVPSAERLLVVIRHGEARGSSASGDEGRELTESGREDVREIGRWLTEQSLAPDVAIVSSATRTRQTWDALQAAGVEAADVRVDRAVYNGTVGDILEAVSAVPAEARVVVVIAHAPAVPELAMHVEAACDVPEGWAPGTTGVIALGGEWTDGVDDRASLVACRTPRRLRGPGA